MKYRYISECVSLPDWDLSHGGLPLEEPDRTRVRDLIEYDLNYTIRLHSHSVLSPNKYFLIWEVSFYDSKQTIKL